MSKHGAALEDVYKMEHAPVDREIKVKEINRMKIKTYLGAELLSERVQAAHGTFLLVQCIEKQALLLQKSLLLKTPNEERRKGSQSKRLHR